MMKRWLCCLAGLALVLSCNPVTPEEPSEPELIVTGVPEEPVKAYTSFTLSVSSKSDGYIDYKSSDKSLATISISGRRQYTVDVKAPLKISEVSFIFTQEADEDYPELSKTVTITILPESMDSGPTSPDDQHADLDGVKVSFTEATDLLVNPERGMYRSRDFGDGSDPLSVAEIKAQRLSGHTLWYTGYYLTHFMEGDISQSFLDMIQANMDALREGGSKCILRFAYRDYHNDTDDMEPEVSVVMRHVEQLKPLFQKNEDVIFVLQAGFVGSWGEWYYTTHFNFNPRNAAEYAPRKQLVEALLGALPASRQIQLRTPEFKMKMYGLSVKDTITAATAHDGSTLSRLAGHNDCFGASENDYGTFDNVSRDREFWKGDSRYFIMGGETCGESDFCICEATLKDLKDYHWTHLNEDYHSGVIKRWRHDDCYSQIVARLGYRLVMKDLFYSRDFAAGKACSVALRFYNTGFAAPMNPRNARLIWIGSDGSKSESAINSNPLTWHSGWHVVKTSFTPSSAKGTLYLALEDPLLPGRPEYSIALANEDVFDSSTGYNKLFEIK